MWRWGVECCCGGGSALATIFELDPATGLVINHAAIGTAMWMGLRPDGDFSIFADPPDATSRLHRISLALATVWEGTGGWSLGVAGQAINTAGACYVRPDIGNTMSLLSASDGTVSWTESLEIVSGSYAILGCDGSDAIVQRQDFGLGGDGLSLARYDDTGSQVYSIAQPTIGGSMPSYYTPGVSNGHFFGRTSNFATVYKFDASDGAYTGDAYTMGGWDSPQIRGVHSSGDVVYLVGREKQSEGGSYEGVLIQLDLSDMTENWKLYLTDETSMSPFRVWSFGDDVFIAPGGSFGEGALGLAKVDAGEQEIVWVSSDVGIVGDGSGAGGYGSNQTYEWIYDVAKSGSRLFCCGTLHGPFPL